jgi:predicted ribosome quality control (RQC) complex YloA/Tae2 family protein
VIGGRDATSNEIVIKKHTIASDLVFHTDMAGSPFFVLKSSTDNTKGLDQQSIKEAADATCSFSRAWKMGLSTQSVFYVNPEQKSSK